MSAPTVHGRARRATALVFAGWTAIAWAIGGWILLSTIERADERSAGAQLERRLAGLQAALASRGADLEARLDELASSLRADAARLERLAHGGAQVAGEADRLATATGFDVLSVLDPRETVLSSRHWPELAGLPARSLAGLPADRPVLRRVAAAERAATALVVRRELAWEGAPLSLVAGRTIDESWLRELAPDGALAWVELEGDDRPRVTLVGAPEGVAWAEAARELTVLGHDPLEVVRRATGWHARAVTLNDDRGRPLVRVLLARPAADPGWQARGPAILLVALGLAATVGAAVVGARLAARAERPVERLVRAVDAIAAGEADYTFPDRPRHGLDRLAPAFSRLQRALDRQRRRSAAAERVAAWKEIARRVAHEVKNPLAPIRLTVENLTRARDRDPRVFDELFRDGARTILEEVEQLSRLVGEFSEFARLPEPRLRPVEIHDTVDAVLELYAADADLEIVRDYAARPARVRIDAEQIGRALKNVVGNAVEAARAAAARPRLEVRTTSEGGMVELRFEDNGPGIPPEHRARIFEPYFTTKSTGTGLGMAIAFRIVSEHGGWIEADERDGGGASVRIRLPLADAPAVAGDGGA